MFWAIKIEIFLMHLCFVAAKKQSFGHSGSICNSNTWVSTATSTKPELEFRYDGMGNRIMKIVKPQTGGTAQKQEHWAYIIYSRDATGNTITVYERHWASALTFTSPNAVATVGVPATGIRFG